MREHKWVRGVNLAKDATCTAKPFNKVLMDQQISSCRKYLSAFLQAEAISLTNSSGTKEKKLDPISVPNYTNSQIHFQLMEGEGVNFKSFSSHIKQADLNFIESPSLETFSTSPLPFFRQAKY